MEKQIVPKLKPAKFGSFISFLSIFFIFLSFSAAYIFRFFRANASTCMDVKYVFNAYKNFF